jgi:hypothetical protein
LQLFVLQALPGDVAVNPHLGRAAVRVLDDPAAHMEDAILRSDLT